MYLPKSSTLLFRLSAETFDICREIPEFVLGLSIRYTCLVIRGTTRSELIRPDSSRRILSIYDGRIYFSPSSPTLPKSPTFTLLFDILT